MRFFCWEGGEGAEPRFPWKCFEKEIATNFLAFGVVCVQYGCDLADNFRPPLSEFSGSAQEYRSAFAFVPWWSFSPCMLICLHHKEI